MMHTQYKSRLTVHDEALVVRPGPRPSVYGLGPLQGFQIDLPTRDVLDYLPSLDTSWLGMDVLYVCTSM